MVHVALARLRLDGVEPLREAEVGQSQRAQDLRLAPRKEPVPWTRGSTAPRLRSA